MVTVSLPDNLRTLFLGCPRKVESEPGTVLEVIERLNQRWPGMRSRLLDAGPRLRQHIKVAVNGELATLATAVPDGAQLRIIPAITGG